MSLAHETLPLFFNIYLLGCEQDSHIPKHAEQRMIISSRRQYTSSSSTKENEKVFHRDVPSIKTTTPCSMLCNPNPKHKFQSLSSHQGETFPKHFSC